MSLTTWFRDRKERKAGRVLVDSGRRMTFDEIFHILRELGNVDSVVNYMERSDMLAASNPNDKIDDPKRMVASEIPEYLLDRMKSSQPVNERHWGGGRTGSFRHYEGSVDERYLIHLTSHHMNARDEPRPDKYANIDILVEKAEVQE